MLLPLFGIMFFTVIFLPLFIYKAKMLKSQNNSIINLLKFVLLYVGFSLIVIYTVFPLPIDEECINNKYLAQSNYINPSDEFINYYKTIPDDQKENFILVYLYNIIKQTLFYSMVFVFIYQVHKIYLFMYLLLIGIIPEITQYIIGLIIGLNYKSVNTKDIIVAFIGISFGFLLYKLIFIFTDKYKDESDILLFIYKLLY